MTTQRAPIGRRLAVGRRSHSPPAGHRRSRHRLILAPVAATLAATFAVGVAIAGARRVRRAPEGPRGLGVHDGESCEEALRRIALEQCDLAIAMLSSDPQTPEYERAVHETRKAIKRLRALLRLLREDIGEHAYRRDSETLREVASALAGARDAEVMLATLDSLIERRPKRLGRRRGVRRLRRRLAREHERAARRTLGDPLVRARALGGMRAFRVRASGWELGTGDAPELVRTGVLRLYSEGRSRLRRVRRGRGDQTLAMHRWRKRVKDLRYVSEILEPEHSGKRLRAIARRADDLGELLGEEHDLAVLAELVRSRRKGRGRVGPGTRKVLLREIRERRGRLRGEALRRGKKLYGEKPGAFTRGFVRASGPSATRR